ncbi:MAG: antirestriction protein [Gammaproteobacteria bacterium]|nr:antirestriction protein [Gammaproteobacteria bacterium]
MTTETVTSKKIAETDRLNFLSRHLGKLCVEVEQYVYKLADMYVKDYNGGYWEFYELSNGGFYIAQNEAELIKFENQDNYFETVADANTIGMVLTLFTLSELSFKYPEGLLAEKFHLLRDYALDSEHGAIIAKAID